jgi:hypothetical protein
VGPHGADGFHINPLVLDPMLDDEVVRRVKAALA